MARKDDETVAARANVGVHGPIDQHGNRYGMPIEKAKEEVLKQLPVKKQ